MRRCLCIVGIAALFCSDEYAPDSPYTSSSFLRKQESHNVVCDNSPIRPRFPVTPEDHSCEGRNLTVSCATIRQFAPDSPFPRKTIPAKAGISQPCAANGGVTKAAMPPMTKRFLPTQEWSVSGRECVGDFGDCADTTL